MNHTVHRLPRGEVHVTRAEAVYPLLTPGSVRLVISDGPYGMGKAAWDRQRTADDLRDWYAPHVEAWGRVCAPAASVYLWGTQRGVRALQPLMEAHGWEWRTCVVWDKGFTPANLGWKTCGVWPDVTEACDVYERGGASVSLGGPSGNVWRRNMMLEKPDRLYRPGLHPDRNPERGDTREGLHPCQKPLAFYDRIIRASSRPGDLVLEPFGGTLRAAVACETMPADEARRYVCIEPDEDGRGYVPAALADLHRRTAAPTLWGGFG